MELVRIRGLAFLLEGLDLARADLKVLLQRVKIARSCHMVPREKKKREKEKKKTHVGIKLLLVDLGGLANLFKGGGGGGGGGGCI